MEICINNAWGTVCDTLFGREDATVVCGQLEGFQSEGESCISTSLFSQQLRSSFSPKINSVITQKQPACTDDLMHSITWEYRKISCSKLSSQLAVVTECIDSLRLMLC